MPQNQDTDHLGPQKAHISALPYFFREADESSSGSPATPKSPNAWHAANAQQQNVRPASFASLRTESAPAQAPQQIPAQPVQSRPASGEGRDLEGDEFWALIDELLTLVADRHSIYLSEHPEHASDPELVEELGRKHIAETVQEQADRVVGGQGQSHVWSAKTQRRLERALFDAMFRLARLQPLIDDPTIENIHLLGHQHAFVQRVGSTSLEAIDPIARTDNELIHLIQQMSRSKGDGARDFSAANPSLHLDLPAGELRVRLHATMPPFSERPEAIIRVHRYLNISLPQMVQMGTLSEAAAHFLTTLVRAGKSCIVGGVPGDGKTTMVRALAESIDPMAQIVTVETERELHLEKLETRVVPPKAYEYIPPGEGGAGELSLDKAVADGLRDNSRYIIVGEVRGPEIVPMIRAMQVGIGSMSTTHAYDPDDCVEALAGLGRSAYGEEYMARQLGRHLGFIIQMGMVDLADGTQRRRVTHISEVRPSNDSSSGVTTNDLFHLAQGEHTAHFEALPENPRTLADLERAGLDHAILERGRR